MASEDVFRRRAFVSRVPCAESPDRLTRDHGIGEAQEVNGRQLGSIAPPPPKIASRTRPDVGVRKAMFVDGLKGLG